MVFAARMPISMSSLTKANSSCPMAHMDNGDACELGQLPSKKGFSGNEELRSTMPQVFIRLHRLQPYQFQLYVDVVSCVHAANKCSGLFSLAWTKNGQADNTRQHCDYRVTPSSPQNLEQHSDKHDVTCPSANQAPGATKAGQLPGVKHRRVRALSKNFFASRGSARHA
jgi:hypothetical protein